MRSNHHAHTMLPEQDKYEKVKKHIIEVARRVFGQFGFRKTTIDEIAHAARKGKSTIYYYFKNKEDIFRGVVEYEAKILKFKLMDVVSMDLEPKDKMRHYVHTRIGSFQDFGNFYDALKNDFLSHLEFIEKVREKYDRDEMTIIKMILIEGVDKGEFVIQDVESVAEVIRLALKGLELPLFLGQKTKIIEEERIGQVMDVLFYGIAR